MKYIGQTGRSSKISCQEQLRDFKYRNGKSSFAQRLIEYGHAIGSMEQMMETVYFTNKGRLMDTLERFYLFLEKIK